MDVLVDGNGGVGNGSSFAKFRNEFIVDDLPRSPSLARVGDDAVDALEPCRKRGTPGPARPALDLTRAEGEGNGVAKPWPPTSSVDAERKALTADDSDPKARTELLTDGRGADSPSWLCFCGDDFWGLDSEVSNSKAFEYKTTYRCERSNRGAGFFRRGRRKKVVVV